jgi:hypothetical protein
MAWNGQNSPTDDTEMMGEEFVWRATAVEVTAAGTGPCK